MANERGIRVADIFICVEHLYHEHSKHAHGNDTTITIRAKHYTPGEAAMLITFFKLQDKWNHALPWRPEEAKGKDGDRGGDVGLTFTVGLS